MANDWVEKSLADICNLIKRGVTPKYSDEGILVINQRCIRDQRISLDAARRHDLNLRKISDEKFLLIGDVLINSTGVGTLGRVAQVNNLSEKTTVDTHVTIARLGLLSEIDINFFGCVMKYKEPVFEAMGEGSTGQTELSRHLVGDVLVRYPKSKNEQKAIAHILGSLDDKIELNRQMNETLEAMAQALFKSWFVDFDPVIDNALAAGNTIPDELLERAEQRKGIEKKGNLGIQSLFPNEFELNEEMGWIPKGWAVSNVGTEFNTVGGGTPSTKNSDFWENGDISWTTPKDLSGNQSKILLNTDRKITELGLNKISSGLLPIDTVLMSSRAPVGYLALAKVPVAINQGYIALKCEKILTPEFAIQWADSAMDEIKQRAGGTTFAEISKTNFRGIPILVPSQKIIDAYSRDVKDLYNQITSRIENINTLAKLRDTLLPKLMSGELRIADAEALVEHV